MVSKLIRTVNLYTGKFKRPIKCEILSTQAAVDVDSDCYWIYENSWLNLGDNCIQNIHLGRYIIGYTNRNLVLWPHAKGPVKCDFRTYIRHYTSLNENFEYGYPHSSALLQFHLKLEHCKPHKAVCHPT